LVFHFNPKNVSTLKLTQIVLLSNTHIHKAHAFTQKCRPHLYIKCFTIFQIASTYRNKSRTKQKTEEMCSQHVHVSAIESSRSSLNIFLLQVKVHPKMKILSVFTHPHVVSTPLDLRSSSEHKLRYF